MEENISSVGLRIKELIKEYNKTQVEISKYTGISQNAISNYINGNRIPDANALIKLSNYFNVSLDWLLLGKKTNYFEVNEIEKNILKKYRELDEKDKIKIETYIDFIYLEKNQGSYTSMNTKEEKEENKISS